MIDLQSRDKPAYANTVGWMAVGDDYNLSELKQERRLGKNQATL
jgi:hypothetical protein